MSMMPNEQERERKLNLMKFLILKAEKENLRDHKTKEEMSKHIIKIIKQIDAKKDL